MLRLNSIADTVFEKAPKDDEKIGKLSRNDIIVSGRYCAAEYIGKTTTSIRRLSDSDGFKSRLEAFGGDYATLSRTHSEEKLLFCAARAYAAIGKAAPENVEQVKRDNSLWRDPIFLRTMSAIDTEVIAPLLYSVISDIAGPMMNVSEVPLGRTKEITILSNDIFLFEDSSWGASRSVTKNYLYNDTITLNPSPYAANATIKWFQLIASDSGMDAGWYYAAIMQGLWSKIMGLFTDALTQGAANTAYVPSYLSFSSYSTANWAAAVVAAAAANGVTSDRLMAFGTRQALQAVLPSGSSADAALTYGLGPEWMRNGFLGVVGGVPLFEINQALVPGTVNTTGDMIFPNDQIYITARVGDAYAPVYCAMAEGSPITIELDPSQTADFTIDINVQAVMDVQPVFGSKIAVIDNVTLS